MSSFTHGFSFDPTYGYSLDDLFEVGCPNEPEGYAAFWKARYQNALKLDPQAQLVDTGEVRSGWRVCDLHYRSTDNLQIGGWCLVPESGRVDRVFVVLHGYGGRDAPDFDLPFGDAAILFPCARGISRSQCEGISPDPNWHVLHHIDDYTHYVHGSCVEDVWLGVSAALSLFPQAQGHVGLLGVSFGGGIGAMALAWDDRIQRGHFNVPSFGNNLLRLGLKTTGSGASVQRMFKEKPKEIEKTLLFHDAAIAARYIRVPVHFACAMFDPMVAPPGQFAVYNAMPMKKELFVLKAGHFDYAEESQQKWELLQKINLFFWRM